eukprot:5802385-Prymnesium_polylepis.1
MVCVWVRVVASCALSQCRVCVCGGEPSPNPLSERHGHARRRASRGDFRVICGFAVRSPTFHAVSTYVAA